MGIPIFEIPQIISTFDMLGMIIIHEAMAFYNQL